MATEDNDIIGPTCSVCGEIHTLAFLSRSNNKCNKYEQDGEGNWMITEDGVKVKEL